MSRLPISCLAALVLSIVAGAPPVGAQGVALPYFESFESPSWPGPEWTIAYSAPAFGRIQTLVPTPLSADGGRAAGFDVSVSGNFSVNTLTIAVNLASTPSAVFKYWAKETGDETHPEDGLFLNDGVGPAWVKVVDHATLTATWTEITVNLAAVAAANALAVTPAFQIRFSQADNFAAPTDGVQIDGVRIVVPPDGQANSAAASLDVNGGQNLFGESAAAGNAGPFFAAATPGGPLVLTVSGPAGSPWILAAGPLHPHNAVIQGVGSLDIGLLGPVDLSDVAIVLDGTAPGFLNSLAHVGPSGTSVLTFALPALPPGPWLSFQAAVVSIPAITLTAATQVTVP
jgi:hypothetical protein